jgi:putative proteasome-type protease
MSYCLSIQTIDGLILCASAYTNNNKYSSTSHMHRFVWPDNRFITILSSGYQNTIDAVLIKIHKDLNQKTAINLLNTSSLDETADYIAAISTQVQTELAQKNHQSVNYGANFIVAGQIHNQNMGTLLIYAQGNYIHEPSTSPFLQIGETKYGKPILDRMAKRHTDLAIAARCALVSVDSTIRSKTSTHFQTELLIYKNNCFEMGAYLLLDEQNAFFKSLSQAWDYGVVTALNRLPKFAWET